MKTKQDLSSFDRSGHKVGATQLKNIVWLIVNALFIRNPLNLSSSIKTVLLRLFGAEIGKGCVFKTGLNIKYPWKLKIGDHCWVGENVWVDNVEFVSIGSNVCISQGALLIAGSHNYHSRSFEYLGDPIVLEDGVWIGAKAVVAKGVVCHSHSVLSLQSVAERDLESYSIYKGNPAVRVRERVIE